MAVDALSGSINDPITIDDGNDKKTTYDVDVNFLEDDFFVDDSNVSSLADADIKPVISQTSYRNVYTSTGTLIPKNTGGRYAPSCFNCDGAHILSKCPFPKDDKKIKAALSLSRSKKGSAQSRYHDESKESKYTPGVISENLRKALNIGELELPPWIYRMRVKGDVGGYPPEFLLDALESNEEVLDFHDADDDEGSSIPCKRRKLNYDLEDLSIPPKLNPNKIHTFLGYNKFSRKMIDNSRRRYQVPYSNDFIFGLEELVRENFCDHNKISDYVLSYRHRRRVEKDLSKMENKEKEESKMNESHIEEEYDNSFVEDNTNRQIIGENSGTIVVNSDDHFKTPTDDKPTLSNFTAGIQPFEAREESMERGFMKKIRSLLKKE
uniref:PSP domain-containing protein n=1 Tax=Parastrongyloides trichosuri TaxID=131310 RepID=A0A0N4ZNQ6_PARTI